MKTLVILCVATLAHAVPPACTTQFQYGCSSATLGGYTVITPLASTGQTQIQGFNSSGTVLFNQTLPIPPVGSTASDTPTQQAVLQADALLAVSLGYAQALTLPACSSSAGPPCLAPNPGASFVVTNSTTSSYVPQDTATSQRIDRYSTTLQATVNGQTVFQQTYAAAFSDPAVQAAVSAADAILAADHATTGTPVQTSSSSALQGSQLAYVLTSDTSLTGNQTVATTTTLGPAVIAVGDGQDEVFFVIAGQSDINVNTDNEYYAARNVITTNTYFNTQTYTIQGTGGTAYSACDINRDGVINVADVQANLQQASGDSPPGAGDLNGDGVVDAVDIQFVINATLNLGCAAVNTTSPNMRSLSTTMSDIHPSGVAIDAAGSLYIAEHTRVLKLTPNGTLSTVADNVDPEGIALDAGGDLYIADTANHRILMLSADGVLSTVSESFLNPTGIAVDRTGNLYVVDNNRVIKLAPDGTRSTEAENVQPASIAVDREGYLVILDTTNRRLVKIAPNGITRSVPLDGPIMAVDAEGNLHFAEAYSRLAWKLFGDGPFSAR